MCNHKRLREWIKEVYGFQCQLSLTVFPSKDLVVHHILPVEYGGLTIPENLIPLSLESHVKVHKEGITHNSQGKEILIRPVPQLEIIERPPLVLVVLAA